MPALPVAAGHRVVAGIFAGGRAMRMGGRPKGLLRIGGETIVARWRRIFDAAAVPCVLVGGEVVLYAPIGLPILRDTPLPGARSPEPEVCLGPLGGLLALLEHARGGLAIAVAC